MRCGLRWLSCCLGNKAEGNAPIGGATAGSHYLTPPPPHIHTHTHTHTRARARAPTPTRTHTFFFPQSSTHTHRQCLPRTAFLRLITQCRRQPTLECQVRCFTSCYSEPTNGSRRQYQASRSVQLSRTPFITPHLPGHDVKNPKVTGKLTHPAAAPPPFLFCEEHLH